jgi:hypothetical protein
VATYEFEEYIIDAGAKREDEWAENVFLRIDYVKTSSSDLPAGDVVYHKECNKNFKQLRQIPPRFLPKDDETPSKKMKQHIDIRQNAFNEALDYFKYERSDEIFTVNDISIKMKTIINTENIEVYCNKTIRNKLNEMPDDIYAIDNPKHLTEYIFRDSMSKVVKDFLNDKDRINQNENIVVTSAKILRAAIKEMNPEKDNYPTPDDMEIKAALEFNPPLLNLFLKTVFNSSDELDARVAFIGQAIIQCTRPRSILCPLCLGVGVQFHNNFQSKLAVEELNGLGVSSSYHTVTNYEHAGAVYLNKALQSLQIPPDTLVQFMGDNADHNTQTLTGHGTFHTMGMMMTTSRPVKLETVIPRVKVSRLDILKAGQVDIKTFYTNDSHGPKIKFDQLSLKSDSELEIHDHDILWKTSVLFKVKRPGYFGTMQLIEKGDNETESSLFFLPIINMEPTDMTCINSTLLHVIKLSEQYKVTPVLTFDFPLYWKALTIATHKEMKIVLRLGGFHTEMMWWNVVGDTMEGSGIEQVIESIYAKNTVPYIMNGKAFNRSQRFNLLNVSALNYIILSDEYGDTQKLLDTENTTEMDITEDSFSSPASSIRNIFDIFTVSNDTRLDGSVTDKPDNVSDNVVNHSDINKLSQLFDDLVINGHQTDDSIPSDIFKKMKKILQTKKTSFLDNPNAALWLQYMDLVDLGITFERSEQLGEWEKQLICLRKMLPYCAATGHFLYTKGIYVFLMMMEKLPGEYPEVYKHFMEGRHCIRRSKKKAWRYI